MLFEGKVSGISQGGLQDFRTIIVVGSKAHYSQTWVYSQWSEQASTTNYQ